MGTWTPTDYNPDDFANRRHIGPSPAEMAEMLKAVGVDSLEALIDQTVPAGIRQASTAAGTVRARAVQVTTEVRSWRRVSRPTIPRVMRKPSSPATLATEVTVARVRLSSPRACCT